MAASLGAVLWFLLADPGAGKTIMAGLLIKELKVRPDGFELLRLEGSLTPEGTRGIRPPEVRRVPRNSTEDSP